MIGLLGIGMAASFACSNALGCARGRWPRSSTPALRLLARVISLHQAGSQAGSRIQLLSLQWLHLRDLLQVKGTAETEVMCRAEIPFRIRKL